ncbi:hypothetical protein G6F56_008316 [Rhizopus delemar]|uniref:Uncharacterized protein n=1 Tax=Rhizopus stolonifer TaxID=4846 RepID=A0A367IRX1_RHIST|nr:hypothetical protein G6F56_008316 [Rhizopus delemar]RCH80386.1 hypothetical protein CU098_002061 [Rhizopus stolonifer]
MSSPVHPTSTKYDSKERSLEVINDSRYSKRLKSLVTDTPPRDSFRTAELTSMRSPERISTNYPSPLRRNVINMDRYKTVEVRNEDFGDWRENASSKESQVKQVEETAQVVEKPEPKPSTIEKKKPKANRTPHYMQGTRSFESRLNSKRDEQKHRDFLSPRSGGGITKRVGISKIPKYKSTTTINAIEDIKNGMTPADGYVPMAARIKLFERGLGNSSNKPPIPRITESHSSTKATRKPKPKTSTTNNRSKSSQEYSNSSIPSYARATESATNRSTNYGDHNSQENESKSKREPSKESKKETKKEIKKEVKPFRFATSERAQHHQETFNEKLRLWKIKEEEQNNEKQKRGTKRKIHSDHASTTESKKKRE